MEFTYDYNKATSNKKKKIKKTGSNKFKNPKIHVMRQSFGKINCWSLRCRINEREENAVVAVKIKSLCNNIVLSYFGNRKIQKKQNKVKSVGPKKYKIKPNKK